MIISHRHRFIFIKTMKTAGTSLEIALSAQCGPEDVITPIGEADERVRRDRGGLGPQNYVTPGRFVEERVTKFPNKPPKTKRREGFFNHMSAAHIQELTDPDVWNRYTKFCVERNPWDRVLSLYYWRYTTEPRPSLEEFVFSGEIGWLHERGYQLYTIGDQVVVDHVLRYEDLENEVERVGAEIGLGELELPRAKALHRVDRRHFSEVLNPRMIGHIGEVFHKEVALFGYSA